MVDGSTLHNGVKVVKDLNFGKGGFISDCLLPLLQSHKKRCRFTTLIIFS